jgi:RecA/RadA recombinase
MVLCGPSSCGKTFVCLSTAREAQKKGYQVVYFDSENAIDSAFARNLGVDPDSLIHIPVKTISQFRNECVKFMREWRADPDTKDIPLVIFVDSVGNLVGTKEMNDVEAEKSASDMGQRAKELRACARVLTMECAENEVLLIATNHTYEVQNMMGAPTIKMGGGEGFVYASSGIVILQSKAVKEDEGKDTEGRKIMTRVANIVVATSEKNRLVPVGMRGYVYIDFKRGVNPNYGMLDDALKYGLIEQKGAWYTVKDKDGNEINKVQKKTLYSKEVWDAILPTLNEKLEADMKYSTFVSDSDTNYVLDDGEVPKEDESSPPEDDLDDTK